MTVVQTEGERNPFHDLQQTIGDHDELTSDWPWGVAEENDRNAINHPNGAQNTNTKP